MSDAALYDAIEATWPAAGMRRLGPFVLRDGQGGGKRVSAASLRGDLPSESDIADAEAAMAAMGQPGLFTLRPEQTAFDTLLEARGYEVVDPTVLYTIPVPRLTELSVPRVTAFAIWEPLAIMEEIWAQGGIGPDRLAVMHRAARPKTAILGRVDDTPAGAAFVGCAHSIAMVHAIEVLPSHRRKGLGRWMLHAAAHWAAAQGCETLALLVTRANAPANALYRAMGFREAGGYHYRIAPDIAPEEPS